MHLPRALASEHAPVAAVVHGGLLQLAGVPDVLELGLGHGEVVTVVTPEAGEDVARVCLAADLDEPTGGLGEDPDESKEQEEGDDLEADGEAPSDLGVSAVDEGEAAGDVLADGSPLRGLKESDWRERNGMKEKEGG
jgi:hypothetical protein